MTNYFKHKMRGKSPGVVAGMIALGIIAILGLAHLFGFIIMWLWNWLMPDLFGLTTITYWQAVGIFILFKILIGGCGGRHRSHLAKHHHGHGSCHGDSSCHGRKKGKRDFSKWKHYDKFWEEEGDKAYDEYVKGQNGDTVDKPENSDNTEQIAEE